MYLGFLFKPQKPVPVARVEPASAPRDRRFARLERRRRADRRRGNHRNYTGKSKRITVDRRKYSAKRRGNTAESAA